MNLFSTVGCCHRAWKGQVKRSVMKHRARWVNTRKGRTFGAKRGGVSKGRGEDLRELRTIVQLTAQRAYGSQTPRRSSMILSSGAAPSTQYQCWSRWPIAHGRSAGTSCPKLGNVRLSFYLRCSLTHLHTLFLLDHLLWESQIWGCKDTQAVNGEACLWRSRGLQPTMWVSLEADSPAELTATPQCSADTEPEPPSKTTLIFLILRNCEIVVLSC